MPYPKDLDHGHRVVDAISNAVFTTPGGPDPLQRRSQLTSDLVGPLGERTPAELDDCCGHALGKRPQVALRRSGERDLIAQPAALCSPATTASSGRVSPRSAAAIPSRSAANSSGSLRMSSVSSIDSNSSTLINTATGRPLRVMVTRSRSA